MLPPLMASLMTFYAAGAPAGDRAVNQPDSKGCKAEPRGARQFCEEVARYAELLRLPGYAVAVVRKGKIEALHTAGYANVEQRRPVRADSIFPIASITKTFTAAVVMQYVDERRVALDDYLTEYPQFNDAAAWPYSSPAIRIRHVLSQTSEGAQPGDVFTYNGNRFNNVYGVFVKMSGDSDYPHAFAREVSTRVLERLGLRDTLTSVPTTPGSHVERLVTPYRYDTDRASFVADDDLQRGHTRAHPNSGMLSTIGDLARYIDALDQARLTSKASAETLTAPFVLNDGTASVYGLGWFSEQWSGTRLNWVYGLGPSYSSYVLRVPGERLTLIFLANTDAPTAALRLNYGNALQFPLAASFLRSFAGKALPRVDVDAGSLEARLAKMTGTERDAAFAQLTGTALTQRFIEQTYGARPGRALQLAALMQRTGEEYLRSLHPDLIGLIAALAAPSLLDAMDAQAAAYDAAGHIDPRISQDLGDFYERVGADEKSMRYRQALLSAPGFESNDATILAAFALGEQHFKRGELAAGRRCYWTGIRNAIGAGWSHGFAETKRQQMNARSAAAARP